MAAIQPKWDEKKLAFFQALTDTFLTIEDWSAIELENSFKALTTTHAIKPGELMLPLRIMLVGGKFGPAVFDIASFIGKEETIKRIKHVVSLLTH
jgi:glutamyl-tRNA synthetase